METDFEEEKKVNMPEDDPEAWQESEEDVMTRAAAIVSVWITWIMNGCGAVLTLPRADLAIPLVKEIADKAQFSNSL